MNGNKFEHASWLLYLKAPFLMQTSISMLRKRAQGMIFKQLNEKLEFFLNLFEEKIQNLPQSLAQFQPNALVYICL